jgi:transposase
VSFCIFNFSSKPLAYGAVESFGRKDRAILGLMRRHQWKLSTEKSVQLENYFSQHPEIKALYKFKQGLVELLLNKRVTAKKQKALSPNFSGT